MYLGEVKGIYYVIAVKALSLFRMTLYKPSPWRNKNQKPSGIVIKKFPWKGTFELCYHFSYLIENTLSCYAC